MKIFYSASQNGFFEEHQNLPDDAKEITDSCRIELITAQNEGGTIRPGNDGMPVIILASDYVPELTEDEQQWLAESKKQSLLSEATKKIDPLNDAVDLEIATEKEMSALKEWKKYRVLLMRVDTADPAWPMPPSAYAG